MGGEQSGLVTPVPVTLNSALPFCTGKVPSATVAPLFSALGRLLPGLTQATSAVTATLIWVSSPSPATLPATVIASPERLMVGVPTKCGLPAHAGSAASASTASASMVAMMSRRIKSPHLRTGALPASRAGAGGRGRGPNLGAGTLQEGTGRPGGGRWPGPGPPPQARPSAQARSAA